MTLQQAMSRLEACGNESTRKTNAKYGVGSNQFGARMGDIRAIAKEAKIDHELGLELWATENHDARLLATLVMKPKKLSCEELQSLVATIEAPHLADWFMTNVVRKHPAKEALRQLWMQPCPPMQARLGWYLTSDRISKEPEGLDLEAILDRIEGEMLNAPEVVQWTMNFCLAEIGIKFAEHRARAIAIGEQLGVYRDYPTSKGCTSPYAPTWIAEMVNRAG